jgi:hypothetical protein
MTLLNTRLVEGLQLLRQALEAALSLSQDPWEFAVEIDQLHVIGLTNTDLRWMVCQGYTQHALEQERPRSGRRSFRRPTSLGFPANSCFILTPSGMEIAGAGELTPGQGGAGATDLPAAVPRWDTFRRQLFWQGHLVKQFRVRAANQELILTALEEEGWPTRIDDPLPQTKDLDPKARLHDTIKGLNRNQKRRLLRFRGDGTGVGVVWAPVKLG